MVVLQARCNYVYASPNNRCQNRISNSQDYKSGLWVQRRRDTNNTFGGAQRGQGLILSSCTVLSSQTSICNDGLLCVFRRQNHDASGSQLAAAAPSRPDAWQCRLHSLRSQTHWERRQWHHPSSKLVMHRGTKPCCSSRPVVDCSHACRGCRLEGSNRMQQVFIYVPFVIVWWFRRDLRGCLHPGALPVYRPRPLPGSQLHRDDRQLTAGWQRCSHDPRARCKLDHNQHHHQGQRMHQTRPGQDGVTVEGQTSRLHIEDSRFINNSHTLVEAPVMYIGGRTNATISNTNFSDNYAAYPLRGGGILIDEDATGVSGHVKGLLRLLCAKLSRQAH